MAALRTHPGNWRPANPHAEGNVGKPGLFPQSVLRPVRAALTDHLRGGEDAGRDNIFVIAPIFGFFAIPRGYQHRMLIRGILSVIVVCGNIIGLGGPIVYQDH